MEAELAPILQSQRHSWLLGSVSPVPAAAPCRGRTPGQARSPLVSHSLGPRGPRGHHTWLRADSHRSSCGRESNDLKPFSPRARGTGSGPITGTSSRDSSSRSSQREEMNVSAGDRATGSATPWIFLFPGAVCVECCVRGARAPHRAGGWRGCNPSLRTNSW